MIVVFDFLMFQTLANQFQLLSPPLLRTIDPPIPYILPMNVILLLFRQPCRHAECAHQQLAQEIKYRYIGVFNFLVSIRNLCLSIWFFAASHDFFVQRILRCH